MTYWNTAVSETNGINIHYTRTGGNKQPLILLHGLMANGLCWTSLAHVLEKEYDVIMPDARGHGNSSVPDFGYRYEDHANDVVGLMISWCLAPGALATPLLTAGKITSSFPYSASTSTTPWRFCAYP